MSHKLIPAIASAASLLVALPSAAWEQTPSGLTLNAGYTLQTDDNLFRFPSTVAARSERIGISTLGVGFNTTQSLQKIEARVSLVDYKYNNFDYLSFTARNYDVAWRWAFTPRWTGNLTSDRRETLNSFADYQNINQRNQRVDANLRLDTIYELSGPWRLIAGAARTRQENQQAVLGDGDYTLTSGDAGLRYVFGSGSAVSYSAKAINGSYPNRVLSAANLSDNSFHQLDNDLRLRWVLNGNSTVDANLTHLSRSYTNFGQRDYSGFATGAGVNWVLSGKTSVSAAYAHELGAYTTSTSNYSATDRISLGTQWQMSAKSVLQLRHTWAQADFLGNPGPSQTLARRDTNRDTSLSVLWAPQQQITLNAGLQQVARSSNQPNLDFAALMATLSAQFTY